jgi:RHS repeat-associated protein
VVTDYRGELYERIEYTPYGELWLEQVKSGIDRLPFRFTGKELDEETGLYYYGARYLDPKTSRWISADPALGEYLPSAPINEEARRRNQNLPGMGGIYNLVNAQLYHYAGNNPVKYTDPDGRTSLDIDNQVIVADITDDADMRKALDQLYVLGDIGYTVNAVDRDGNGFKFDNYADMLDYVTSGVDYMDGLRFLAGIASNASLGIYAFGKTKSVRTLGNNASFGFTFAAVVLDGIVFTENPNLDTFTNVGITALGFIPALGPLVSAEASLVKQGIVASAEGTAKLNYVLKHNPFSILRSTFDYFVRYTH